MSKAADIWPTEHPRVMVRPWRFGIWIIVGVDHHGHIVGDAVFGRRRARKRARHIRERLRGGRFQLRDGNKPHTDWQ